MGFFNSRTNCPLCGYDDPVRITNVDLLQVWIHLHDTIHRFFKATGIHSDEENTGMGMQSLSAALEFAPNGFEDVRAVTHQARLIGFSGTERRNMWVDNVHIKAQYQP